MFHLEIALFYLVIVTVRGNNFPPVENPAPIPAPAVKAPLHLRQSGLYFPDFSPDISRNIPEIPQRWAPNPGFSYVSLGSSEESFQQAPAYPEIGKLYETALPSIGPVATPVPDGLVDSNIRQDSLPQLQPGTVVLTQSNFWTRGKSNPYAVQSMMSVPPVVARTIQIKELQQPVVAPIVSGKNPQVIQVGTINPQIPVQEIRANDPRVYHSFRALIDDLPKPKNIKPQVSQIPPSPSVDLPKNQIVPFPVFSEWANRKSNVDVPPNLPPPDFISNTSNRQYVPPVPVTSFRDIPDAPVIGWFVNPNGQMTPMRGIVMTPKFSQTPVLFNPVSPTARVISATRNGKNAAQVPSRVSVDNTWVLRQSPNGPYFERLRALLPVKSPVTGKGVTEMIVDNDNSKNPIQVVSPKLAQASIIYRRGSDPQPTFNNFKFSNPYTVPHSPKSDVLVIGKGNTLAHLATQREILPLPPPVVNVPTEPCLTQTARQIRPIVPPANFIQPLPNVVPVSRKTLPNALPMRSDTPYSYYIWNPQMNPFMQMQRNAFAGNPMPKSNQFSPNAITRNRLQYPLRYMPPYNMPNIVDVQGRKPVDVRVIPPPLPEAGSLLPSVAVQQSAESGSGAVSIETSSETLPKLTSAEDAIEAEASIVNRLQAQASQQVPSFVSPSLQNTADKQKPITKPYSFELKQRDDSGMVQYKEATSDSSGRVGGRYGHRDASGIYREVDYVEDQEGFHAAVKQIDPKVTIPNVKTTENGNKLVESVK